MQQQTKGSTGVLRGYGALTDSSRTLEMAWQTRLFSRKAWTPPGSRKRGPV